MADPPIRNGPKNAIAIGTSRLDVPPPTSKAGATDIRTLRCRTVAQGHLSQLNYIRDLPPQPVTEKEPDGRIGEASAPNASEALLAALGSCLAIGIHARALAQGIQIRSLELNVEAELNTATTSGDGLPPKPIGLESIRVGVGIEADASRKALAGIVRQAVLWSPVANTLHNPVHLDVTLAVTEAVV